VTEFTKPTRFTVEDLPPGRSTVGIQVVDRATNESPIVTKAAIVDSDTPVVSILRPAPGQKVGRLYQFSAMAADAGGITSVVFKIDGKVIATLGRQPDNVYSTWFDAKNLSLGTHVLTVEASDYLHKKSATSTFVRDNSPFIFVDNGTTVIIEDKKPNENGKLWVFRTPTPKASFESTGALVDGFYYTVRRPNFLADPGLPTNSSGNLNAFAAVSVIDGGAGGTQASPDGGTLDLRWWAAHQPGAYSMRGMKDPVEGMWHVRARSVAESQPVNAAGIVGEQVFLVDITSPEAVKGIFVPGMSAGSWSDQTHRGVFWTNRGFTGTPYDSLSGDASWGIWLNGERIQQIKNIHGGNAGYDSPYGYYAFENLKAGTNTIGIQCIDYAGNAGPVSTYRVGVDTDTPTIKIDQPGSGQWIGDWYNLVSHVYDAGGVTSVKIQVDGSTVASLGPQANHAYSTWFNTNKLSPGKHTLTIVARDHIAAHTKIVTRTFNVDNTHIAIEDVSDTPDPFYPWIRDGYKDDSRISFHLNEGASYAWVQFAESGGSLVREYILRATPAGWTSVLWSGRDSDGGLGLGTYFYRIVAEDRAGNRTTSPWQDTEIRNFEIVRIGPDSVRIVPR
jgi:hypothetical protein